MMDGNNWRPNQAMENSGMPVGGGTDWRGELRQDYRQRIVNKIMETLKKQLPICGAEEVTELNKIAVRFEEKIYTTATSKADYLLKISLKMLSMGAKSNPNALHVNPVMGNQGGQDQGMENSVMAVVGGGTDWRGELSPDFRQGIIETLKKNWPISGAEDVTELNEIAVRFEEKIYTAATSKSDYLRKILLKIVTMRTKSNSNAFSANPVMGNQGGQDQGMENSVMAVVGGGTGTDWRDELLPDFRQGIRETMKIIVDESEEMIYTVARSKDDYLQTISLEMRSMKRKRS